MPETWREELSDAALEECAGATIFERGLAYFEQGKAQLHRDGGGNTTWKVRGTQRYQVELYFEEGQLHVDCTCPYADEAFCKHMVAAGLAWRKHLGADDGAEEGFVEDSSRSATKHQASKGSSTSANRREALRVFVAGQDAATLAERLWAWAERDKALMAELKAWAVQSHALDDPQAAKSAITDLLRSSGFLDWRESGGYADQAQRVVPLLEQVLKSDAAQARQLCEHALRRLYKVCENADDSSGEIGDVVHSVMDLLFRSLKAAPPPAAWLDDWFTLMQADPWGLWSENAVLDVAGDAVVRRYCDKAASDWMQWIKGNPQLAKANAPRPRVSAYRDMDWERHKLRQRYLASLKRQGDTHGVLEVMRSHLADAGEHSELAAYCESQGKMREALQYAQTAYKLYPTDWRCEADVLRCFERDGWDQEALAIRRLRVEKVPSVEHYKAVLMSAKAAGHDVAQYRAELHAWAESCEESQQGDVRATPWRRHASVPSGRNVNTRAQWLLADGMRDEALALVQPPHVCDPALLRDIARKLPKARHAEALPLMLRVFAAVMPGASTPYRDVLALVAETMGLMTLAESRMWLGALRAEYKAKRNFIKGLDALN